MTQNDKMSSEKTPALYMTKIPLDEEDTKKQKVCSRTLLTCILAAILVGLCVVLTVEFLYPFENRYREADIDEVHVFEGKEVNIIPSFDDKTPWHLDFLINPTRLCDTVNPPDSEAYQKDPEVKLLMLVPSATSHFDQRRAIRRTWGSVAQVPQGPLRLGFVLGTTPNFTESELIEKESVAFGDIIQADFEDTYRNLTTKSVLMLKWVSRHCAHAQYFLKADDDTFVNLHVIAQILQKDPYKSEDKFIGGFIHRGAQPYREPDEKYYVSEEEFPGSEFPPYASGAAYMSTGPTAAQLYEASKKATPFIPLEDIFVTGLCAEDIDATLLHEPNFLYQEPPKPISWDSYKTVATAHSVTPDDIDQIWNEMTKSIFDSLRLMNFDAFLDFPGKDLTSAMDSDTVSDLFVFPDRNIGRGFFDFPENDMLAQLFKMPGDRMFSDMDISSMNGKRIDSSASSGIFGSSASSGMFGSSASSGMFGSSASSGIFGFPETEIFNITFFVRK